jgi:hypothetical protein
MFDENTLEPNLGFLKEQIKAIRNTRNRVIYGVI